MQIALYMTINRSKKNQLLVIQLLISFTTLHTNMSTIHALTITLQTLYSFCASSQPVFLRVKLCIEESSYITHCLQCS